MCSRRVFRLLTLKRHRDGVKLKLWQLQEDAAGMVFWHLPELTVGIAVDDIECSYEVSDDGDTRAFGNCDGDRGAGRGLRDFRSHFDWGAERFELCSFKF
jgi:hypothetical protein